MPVTIESRVTVEWTAEQWHLNVEDRDCDAAAAALNEAASAALSCGDADEAWRMFCDAQEKWSDYGAGDTNVTDEFWKLHDFVFLNGEEYWE